MKIKFLILALVFAFQVNAQTKSIKKSAPLIPAPPESVGVSTERLGKIDNMIQNAIKENVIPGATAIICRNGKIVYYKAFGNSDAANNKAFKTDDIFRIASQTKAITSTAVLMLWEEGKFFLDDPISKYIPEFKNPQILESFSSKDSSYTTKPAAKEITIRQLLTHTSGIGYGVIDGDEKFRAIYKKAGIVDLFTTEKVSLASNIKKLAALPLHHEPGEKFTYSESIDVLGYLVEVVSGKPFDVFLRQRILDPLAMNDTHYYLPESKIARLVNIQTKNSEGKFVKFEDNFYKENYPATGAKAFFSGGAGLSSTLKDYATFLQMILNGGEYNGTRFLSRTTVNTMLSNQTGNLMGGENGDKGFGLGFAVLKPKGEERGGQGSIGAYDWGGYFNTSYFADPKEKVIGIIMKQTQRIGNDPTSNQFRQMVFQSIDD
jgi:CubicO group peptidase (beta-lactamase class C family)